jgi:prolyl oligopeptidase
MKKRLLISFIFALFINGAFAGDEKDPFLWLEAVDGKKAIDWVKEKNETTTQFLKKKDCFQPIYDKSLSILNSNERIAYPAMVGEYVYNFWQDKNNERGIWRRTTLQAFSENTPQWETILDLDKLSDQENLKWVWKGVSWLHPEYDRCMIRLSKGGGDAVVIREFDVTSKQFVENGFHIKEAKGYASWIHKDQLIVSSNFGEGTTTASGYPRIVKLWNRGTDLSEAKELIKIDADYMGVWANVINKPERDYIYLSVNKTFYTSELYIWENEKLHQLPIPEDAELDDIFKGEVILRLKSDWKPNDELLPQGSLISLNYQALLKGKYKTKIIFKASKNSTIASVSSTQNYLLLNTIHNIKGELFKVYLKNNQWKTEQLDAPKFGTIYLISASKQNDDFYFSYTGFLAPSTLYYASAKNNKAVKIKSLPHFFDASKFKVEQHWVKSSDGVKIPYFLVGPTGMKMDSKNPTLLYAYGGFEISMKPRYSAMIGANWLEKGGVYVLANIRGGGEFGPQWHQAVLKENRQLAYDDFTAVAKDLIQKKITEPQHLGIQGGSNGGLLVGVAFTQHPELYNAVVCRVPLLDMKRYNKLLAGASWMGEYGNPDIEEEWAYIQKYSPYQNLKKGMKYPKVFFNTSTKDDRVHPGHARKMVAKMESMAYPVYYYENMEGGHAAATTHHQRAFSYALIYAYLWNQLK